MAGEAVATPLPTSGEIVTPRPDRLGVADPDAEGGKLVIGLLQAEGLVGILLTPPHELVAVEAVVIPVKGSVSLDQSDGLLRFHVWPPGTVLFLSSLASRGDGRALNVRVVGAVEKVKKGEKKVAGRMAATGFR